MLQVRGFGESRRYKSLTTKKPGIVVGAVGNPAAGPTTDSMGLNRSLTSVGPSIQDASVQYLVATMQ